MKKVLRKISNKIQAPVTERLNDLNTAILNQGLLNSGFARAAATIPLRKIDESNPISWEFSAFSQSGEDGIIDYLISQVVSSNRYFIEIGAANGIENNTAWLAHARKFSGLMIDGNSQAISIAKSVSTPFMEAMHLFVNDDNIQQLRDLAVYDNPDLFSLDIDGNDYYIVKAILEAAFKPKVFVVEFNSAYGPTAAKTIKYAADFNIIKAHPSYLYYGVSISGWKVLFEKFGYQFVTVDSNGVNAFFIDPSQFNSNFTKQIKGLPFAENSFQMRKFKFGWEKQFELIKNMNFFEIK